MCADNRTTHGWIEDVEGYTTNGWLDVLDIYGELYQIHTDENFIYTATSYGLNIFDFSNNLLTAYIPYNEGFTSVWGNNEKIFIGTTASGIKSIDIVTVSGNTSSNYNLTQHLTDLYEEPYISSNNIKYIHGNGTNLMICTDSGVEYIKTTGNPTFVSSTSIAGAQKCYLSSTAGYYTVSGTEWSINRINNMNTSWDEPNRSYITGSGIFSTGLLLNDIYITEGTGSNETSNCVFCATSSGVYIIDETNIDTEIYNVYTTS